MLGARRAAGTQVVLVSSGAIAAGLAPLSLPARPRDLATQQAAASVGQMLLVERYAASFARSGLLVGQVLLTADDLVRRAHYRNANRTLERLLSLGVVPVVNENDAVATEEIRFGDNDRLAALVAHLVAADALVLLSDVDGLYDGDPRRPGARLVPGGARRGRPGRRADRPARRVRRRHRRDGEQAGRCPDRLRGRGSGAARRRRAGGRGAGRRAGWAPRSRPLPGGRRPGCSGFGTPTTPRGQLILDAGAVDAVVRRRTSLLSAGVTGVRGEFGAGDPVELLGPDGVAVARGLVGYDAAELPELLGRSTRELAPEYRREVVHRDDLVLLRA